MKRVGRLSTIFWLAGAFVLTIPGQPYARSWKKHRYPADGFEIAFSGAVKATPMDLNAAARMRVIRSVQYLEDAGDSIYLATHTLNKHSIDFDQGWMASFRALKCKSMIDDSSIELPSGAGHEVSGANCLDGTLRAECRYFSIGNSFYQIIALFRKGRQPEADARYFLQSFRLIGKS